MKKIIRFWWTEGDFLLEIEGERVTKEVIEKLLDEYREEDEYYDDYGWAEYLEKKGYKVRIIEPDYEIYF